MAASTRRVVICALVAAAAIVHVVLGERVADDVDDTSQSMELDSLTKQQKAIDKLKADDARQSSEEPSELQKAFAKREARKKKAQAEIVALEKQRESNFKEGKEVNQGSTKTEYTEEQIESMNEMWKDSASKEVNNEWNCPESEASDVTAQHCADQTMKKFKAKSLELDDFLGGHDSCCFQCCHTETGANVAECVDPCVSGFPKAAQTEVVEVLEKVYAKDIEKCSSAEERRDASGSEIIRLGKSRRDSAQCDQSRTNVMRDACCLNVCAEPHEVVKGHSSPRCTTACSKAVKWACKSSTCEPTGCKRST